MFWRSESSVSCPASSPTVLRLTAKRPLLCGGQGGIKLGQGSAECFASQPPSDWAFAGQDEFLDTGELCKTLRGAGAPAAAACLRRGVEGKYYLKIASGFTLTSSLRESPIAFHMPHPSSLAERRQGRRFAHAAQRGRLQPPWAEPGISPGAGSRGCSPASRSPKARLLHAENNPSSQPWTARALCVATTGGA